MIEHDYSIGEKVFIFSEVLKEVIEGTIEGFEGEFRTRVKLLQKTNLGMIRHIVSWVYVFREYEEANDALLEYCNSNTEGVVYTSGMTVYLKSSGSIISDSEGNPYLYQITKVYHTRRKVSLVNTYGESVGTFPFSDLEFCSHESIFKSSDYYEGQLVSWIDGEDVYEGVISSLKDYRVEVANIKKLLPIDARKYLPYYKIQSSDSYDNNTILRSIVGDNLDSEE